MAVMRSVRLSVFGTRREQKEEIFASIQGKEDVFPSDKHTRHRVHPASFRCSEGGVVIGYVVVWLPAVPPLSQTLWQSETSSLSRRRGKHGRRLTERSDPLLLRKGFVLIPEGYRVIEQDVENMIDKEGGLMASCLVDCRSNERMRHWQNLAKC